jgi:hypothetical protein
MHTGMNRLDPPALPSVEGVLYGRYRLVCGLGGSLGIQGAAIRLIVVIEPARPNAALDEIATVNIKLTSTSMGDWQSTIDVNPKTTIPGIEIQRSANRIQITIQDTYNAGIPPSDRHPPVGNHTFRVEIGLNDRAMVYLDGVLSYRVFPSK